MNLKHRAAAYAHFVRQPLNMRWFDLLGVGLRLVGRMYGVFFLVLGSLFLYWSIRGLLAFEAGTRTAWADPTAAAAGLGAAALSFWAGIQLFRRGVPASRTFGTSHNPALDATLEEAMKLEESNPRAAQELLESYFMREAENTSRRREELRGRAEHDVRAAVALRKELQQDLADSRVLRKDMLKHASPDQRESLLRAAEQEDQQLSAELAQVEQIIERHELR